MTLGRVIKQDGEREGINLPEIGKIKCGYKDAKGFPVSTDYFIGFGKYASHFEDAYGKKPDIIQVIFYSDDFTKVCNERFELRDKAGKLYGKGNGVAFEIWDKSANNNKGEYKSYNIVDDKQVISNAPKVCESPKGWQRVLTLRFIIPKITGVFGHWSLETKADASSIDAIKDTFDYVFNRAGTVQRVLFDLTVKKHKSQKPGSPSSYPVINLICNVSEQNLLNVKSYIEENQKALMITDSVFKAEENKLLTN